MICLFYCIQKVVITNNRIATSNTSTQSAATQNKANPADSNFEYEDNEWDIGKLSHCSLSLSPLTYSFSFILIERQSLI